MSVVLNGAKTNVRVSEETRQRILAAAIALEYSPNPVAQSLRRRRSGTIAYIFHSLSNSLYERTVPYQLGRLVMQAAARSGYQIIEINSAAYRPVESDETLRLLRSRRVDGVILGWPGDSLQIQQIVDERLPVVQIMKPQPANGPSTVTVDASPGVDAAVDHLVALGHQHIAYLGSNDPHPVEYARFNCFVNALKRHGLPIHREYIKLGNYSVSEGLELTHSILELPERPTAILMIDSLTLGGLRALYEARMHVPSEMSVVSSDDLLAAHLYPPLTSIVQPLQEVADCAISLIEDQLLHLNDGGREPAHIVLPTHLKVRASTTETVKKFYKSH